MITLLQLHEGRVNISRSGRNMCISLIPLSPYFHKFLLISGPVGHTNGSGYCVAQDVITGISTTGHQETLVKEQDGQEVRAV